MPNFPIFTVYFVTNIEKWLTMEDKTLSAEQTTQVLAYTACDLP